MIKGEPLEASTRRDKILFKSITLHARPRWKHCDTLGRSINIRVRRKIFFLILLFFINSFTSFHKFNFIFRQIYIILIRTNRIKARRRLLGMRKEKKVVKNSRYRNILNVEMAERAGASRNIISTGAVPVVGARQVYNGSPNRPDRVFNMALRCLNYDDKLFIIGERCAMYTPI